MRPRISRHTDLQPGVAGDERFLFSRSTVERARLGEGAWLSLTRARDRSRAMSRQATASMLAGRGSAVAQGSCESNPNQGSSCVVDMLGRISTCQEIYARYRQQSHADIENAKEWLDIIKCALKRGMCPDG